MAENSTSKIYLEKEKEFLNLNDGKVKNSQTQQISARQNYAENEGIRIYTNLWILSCSFVLLFTAFNAMASLQSSLNEEDGLGVYSLAAVYIALSISALFLPSLLIQNFTCKWTLVFSMTGYMIYIGAQFYPTFYTLIPAGFLVGICAAPLWSSQSVYVTKIGEEYAFLNNISSETTLQRFFGFFFLLIQSSMVWGNLLAAFILAPPDNGVENYTTADEINLSICGANNCPSIMSDSNNGTQTTISQKPDATLVYLLSGIFLALSVLAAIILGVCLDSLERYGEKEQSDAESTSAKDLILASIKHLQNPNQILLIPGTMWIGIQAAFIQSDVTLTFVACAWGVDKIGYFMIACGISDALSSYCFGRIIKYIGRPPAFILSAVSSFCALIFLLNWTPSPDQPLTFIVVAAVFGFADGIWLPQFIALYGSIFPDTKGAAFSNNRFWMSIGFAITYVNGTLFCMTSRMYFCIVFLILSTVCYLILEIILYRKQEKSLQGLNNNSS